MRRTDILFYAITISLIALLGNQQIPPSFFPVNTNEIVLINKAIDLPINGFFDGEGKTYEPAIGYTGPCFSLTNGGFILKNCVITGFSTGILVNSSDDNNGMSESYIENCRVYNYSKAGINWQNLTDSYILNCICANNVGSTGGKTYVNPDPFFPAYGGITTNTAYAGIQVGPGSCGGMTISNCHLWGNQLFDIADFASDSYLLNNRYEGGRSSMIGMFSFGIHVYGGSIWSFLDGKTFPNGVSPQIAITCGTTYNGVNYDAGNCDVENLWVNQQGFIPYIVGNDSDYGGNIINVKVPPDYKPTYDFYNNAGFNIINGSRLNVAVQGQPNPGNVWTP